MKITNLSNAHLTEITSEEADSVNGGSGYAHVHYAKIYDDHFDLSAILSDFWKKVPKIHQQIKGYSGYKDHYKIDYAAVDSPTEMMVSSSKDSAYYPYS